MPDTTEIYTRYKVSIRQLIFPTENVCHVLSMFVGLGNLFSQKRSQSNCFREIVHFQTHNSSPRLYCKRLRQSVGAEKLLTIEVIPTSNHGCKIRRIFERADLEKILQNKAGVEMVDKFPGLVGGVKPGPVGSLVLENEIQIALSRASRSAASNKTQAR